VLLGFIATRRGKDLDVDVSHQTYGDMWKTSATDLILRAFLNRHCHQYLVFRYGSSASRLLLLLCSCWRQKRMVSKGSSFD
jgi:hypothetical protein